MRNGGFWLIPVILLLAGYSSAQVIRENESSGGA